MAQSNNYSICFDTTPKTKVHVTESFMHQRTTNPYFYDRDDWAVILAFLSPWNVEIEKFFPFFHYLGVATNMLCICVFTTKNFIKRKSIFFKAYLAFADFMYNLASVLPHFLMLTHLFDHKVNKTSNLSCFIYDYVITTFHFYSVCITLLITIDRFNHIYKPLKLHRKLDDLRSKKLIVFSLLLFACVIALPHGFLRVYNEREKDCDARVFFRKRLQNSTITYYQIYFMYTEPIFVWLLPGMFMSLLNFYVVYKIFKTNDKYSRKFLRNFKGLHYFKEQPSNFSVSHNISLINTQIVVHKHNWYESFRNPTSNYTHSLLLVNKVEINRAKSALGSTASKDRSSSMNVNTNLLITKNQKNSKLSLIQLTHCLSILFVGFIFILSTMPYGIALSKQNNITFSLNYALNNLGDYLTDSMWIKFGQLKEWVVFFKIFFILYHCFNFFVYLVFHRLFRKIICDFFKKFKCS